MYVALVSIHCGIVSVIFYRIDCPSLVSLLLEVTVISCGVPCRTL